MNRNSNHRWLVFLLRAPLPLGFVWLFVLLGCSAGYGQTPGIPKADGPFNHSLLLTEKGSYLELPPDVFNAFSEATVEAWVKWSAIGKRFQRIFNYGGGNRDFSLTTVAGTSTLWFLIGDPPNGLQSVKAENALQVGEWTHIVGVAGSGGMKLYLNGELVATNPYTGCFKSLGAGNANRLGQTVTAGVDDTPFEGEIAEVRVWKTARSLEQIRDNMAKPLTGKEAGLAALWNFDDPKRPGRDATGHGHDGVLKGGERAVQNAVNVAAGLALRRRALKFDGNCSIELPTGLFTDLKQATVEAWVRWDDCKTEQRFFSYGNLARDVFIGCVPGTGELQFALRDAQKSFHPLNSGRLLQQGTWCHVAAVSGSGGARLFFNGVEAASDPETKHSFAAIPPGPAWIGRWIDEGSGFKGFLAEFRIWAEARTAEQIREGMWQSLTGREKGLVGLWNFADPANPGRDASPGRHHGKMVGAAAVVETVLPLHSILGRGVTIAGRVTDSKGRPVSGAAVSLHQGGVRVAGTTSDIAGEYRIRLNRSNWLPWELRAAKDDLAFARPNLQLLEDQPASWDITLVETFLSGRLIAPGGEPQAGVKVDLLRRTRGTVAATTLSGANGDFRFRIDTPDSYQLRAATTTGGVLLDGGRAIAVAMGNPVTGMKFEIAARKPTGTTSALVPNRVLHLRGNRQYLHLPSGVFGDLEESTVEGWVKWERFTKRGRFFDFGKVDHTMYVESGTLEQPLLGFRVQTSQQNFGEIWARALRTNQWVHIAAVSGKQGMRLYLNGLLIGTRPYTGSFRSLGNNDNNYFGRSNWGSDDYFQGQMDEVRVWVTARTQEQIRANMFKRLTGNEAGLAGLWNFDGADAKDATPNALDGELHNDATTTTSNVPQSLAELELPTVLYGRLTDEAGKPVSQAFVQIKQGPNFTQAVNSDIEGRYRLTFYASKKPVSLRVTAGTLGAWRPNLLYAGGETKLDLMLHDATNLSGKVVALDDSPLPNVVVQAVSVVEYECAMPGGLTGEYYQMDEMFDGASFPALPSDRAPTLKRVDAEINFRNLPENKPLAGTTLSTRYCVRWTGEFKLSKSGRFTFGSSD